MKPIKLTEKDIKSIVTKIINESDESMHLYKKIRSSSEELDSVIKKLQIRKDFLNELLMKHVRSNSGDEIFDPNKRTPRDVIGAVDDLNRSLRGLETWLGEYKNIIRRSISL